MERANQMRNGGNVWGQPVGVHSVRTNPYNNDVSTHATITQMRQYAHQCARHPVVVNAVIDALGGAARSQRDIADALFYWVRHNVQFTEDEELMYESLGVPIQSLDKELLILPPVLLTMPQPMGDCDDYSLLLASMLLCCGMRPYFVTVAADADDLRKWSHIYVMTYLQDEGKYMCLDAGNRFPVVPPGWEADKVTRKAIWAV